LDTEQTDKQNTERKQVKPATATRLEEFHGEDGEYMSKAHHQEEYTQKGQVDRKKTTTRVCPERRTYAICHV
jgi:hypothetical protein